MTKTIKTSTIQPVKITRRRFLRYLSGGIVAATIAVPSYSFFLERYWIDTTEVSLSLKRLPESFKGLRVVQISDLHIGFFLGARYVRELVKRINALEPDLICFTGDLVDNELTRVAANVPALQSLKAPYGKMAILGNHDYKVGKQDEVIHYLKMSGFTFLLNRHTFIEKESKRLYIAGIDDLFGGRPDIGAAVHGIPANAFTLLLAHEPDLADLAAHFPIDLQLSGHSHGGQIRIPFMGALYRPDGAFKYVSGLKHIEGSDLKLYVNRGIGTTFLPFRFDCRPEITVFTLT